MFLIHGFVGFLRSGERLAVDGVHGRVAPAASMYDILKRVARRL